MCELLTEVVEENLRPVTDNSKRRVVTHRCYRLLPGSRHRYNGSIYVLLSEAEGDELAFVVLHRVLHMPSALEFLQLDAVRREPFTIRMCLRQLFLNLTVVVYLAFPSIDEQNLSWL